MSYVHTITLNTLRWAHVLLVMTCFSMIARDPVTASISTVGWRQEALAVVVKSILPQVDRLNVFLQHYEKIPPFLNDPKITVVMGTDFPEAMALGSGAKFFWAEQVRGYHFTIDDDIIYPPDYIDYYISKIEQYGRKAAVGIYGAIFKPVINDFLKDSVTWNFMRALDKDRPVHILGTGTLAYHTDTIRVRITDILSRNMTDLWFAVLGQKQKIPFIALTRHDKYLDRVPGFGSDPHAIKWEVKRDHTAQTALAKQYQPWQLFCAS